MNRGKTKWLKISAAATLAMALVISTVATVAAGPPTVAPGNSDVAIIPLGKAFDKDGREVEGLMIIHYKRGFGHKPKHNPGGNGGNGGDTTSTCFAFFANGARWKTTEDYLVDPSNNAGLATGGGPGAVPGIVATSLETWDTEVGFNIFGNEVAGTVDGIDLESPDDKNEVLFGDIDSPGAIAVTVVWGIFRGPPFMRELVEWDALFDDADFDWSTSGEAGKMDFQNIATHEFGHSAGMAHPDDSCTEETMFRFASDGETKKQTLNAGDIAGINKLY